LPELPNSEWDSPVLPTWQPLNQLAATNFAPTCLPGDEEAWLDILATGDFGVWDRARLDRMLARERAPLPREGVVFTTIKNVPVGVANLFLYERACSPYSELGWVVVRSEHRGRGLGYEVCRHALLFAKSLKHSYTYLTTQDFRLGAIKTYLRLGFGPELIRPDHWARWNELRCIMQARVN
jgi:mycothiol synthase